MAVLDVQAVLQSGIVPTFKAATSGGDTFANDGKTYLHVKNSGTGAVTVTVDSFTPCSYGFDHDIVISIPAGSERIIGTFPQNRFNNDSSMVSVSYSTVASVTVAAFRV
ncbi:hypothetical protein [Priestia aryabhattai]|uniref:hypothetical protein n=1 Tax=Priestia aryabhattai TaxID=412384 RepID=UPI002E205D2B|nr:hypothetical protein [Priestia aryabhattai]